MSMPLTPYDELNSTIGVAEDALKRLAKEGKTPQERLDAIEKNIALMRLQLLGGSNDHSNY